MVHSTVGRFDLTNRAQNQVLKDPPRHRYPRLKPWARICSRFRLRPISPFSYVGQVAAKSVPPTNQSPITSHYSYRSASIGSKDAALCAGYRPKMRPIAEQTRTPTIDQPQGKTIWALTYAANPLPAATPRTIPLKAPISD